MGVPDPGTGQGRSLLPLLRGEAPSGWRKHAVSSFCFGARGATGAPGRTTLVTRDWTYLYLGNGMAELYDAREDPRQSRNLAGERPEVLPALHEQLVQYLEHLGTPGAYLDVRRESPRPAPRAGTWLGPQGRDPSAQLL
jgi:hypothetical protein